MPSISCKSQFGEGRHCDGAQVSGLQVPKLDRHSYGEMSEEDQQDETGQHEYKRYRGVAREPKTPSAETPP
jgi:hypothetical protein